MVRSVILVVCACALSGCLERRVRITSDPPGALVTANDVELGRTPVEADFLYYGTYDVLLTKDGYEPLRTRAKADQPIHEFPPFDLAATALPARVEHVTRWDFKLEPTRESVESREELEAGLLERARAAREQIEPPK
ncbi:MAG: PEGA domain-containing protein [Phycisphaerae bacterium]|nr:PEGA domain-containing protein [Phycisphaerae bacterium]